MHGQGTPERLKEPGPDLGLRPLRFLRWTLFSVLRVGPFCGPNTVGRQTEPPGCAKRAIKLCTIKPPASVICRWGVSPFRMCVKSTLWCLVQNMRPGRTSRAWNVLSKCGCIKASRVTSGRPRSISGLGPAHAFARGCPVPSRHVQGLCAAPFARLESPGSAWPRVCG
jgi:hypothetical protein